MLAALAVVLLAALIVARDLLLARPAAKPRVNGPPELIKAPPGPYKVKPPNPGGLDVAGESETAFETSAGEDSDAQLDLSKMPEAPVAKPAQGRSPDSAEGRNPRPSASRARAAAPTGGTRQRRFSSAPSPTRRRPSAHGPRCRRAFPRRRHEQADRAVPGRDPARARRGSPAEAKQACQTLKAAGENCFVAQ